MGNNNPNEIYVYVDSSPSQGISFLNLIIIHGFQCMKASRFYTHELSASLLKNKLVEIVISTLEMALVSSRKTTENLFLLLTCHHGKAFWLYYDIGYFDRWILYHTVDE